ncbi:MAG: hypothetical protein U0R51_02525 [Solirubrobacterales bacterium]
MSMATGKSLDSYRAEAAKCVLVCANCHGEIEAGLIPSPPPGAKWGEEWEPVVLPTGSVVAADPAMPAPQLPLPLQLGEEG